MIVVSDASPLHYLILIPQAELLPAAGQISVRPRQWWKRFTSHVRASPTIGQD